MLTLDLAAITQEVVDNYVRWDKNGHGYLNCFVGSRKKPDKFGHHLYVKVEGIDGKRPEKNIYIGVGKSCRFRMPTPSQRKAAARAKKEEQQEENAD